ncbi:phage tail tape measure protein [Tamlana sp. s12]|uniref:phage tail tape measure protein n=1 Tax=Tamlana sp. s12 TaxID=1630406 RepID=UPI0007FE11C6|nr:phage tail tape measure protein [Tamlana sp. s12]OBQ56119.1 hypothetical protein VQ01_06960 [Tamlana sp. s12]QQY83367.1 phage tail tape measure protein [Tamlana sp. s12]
MSKTILDEVMKLSIVVNGNEAQKELFELEKSTRNLTAQNKQYREEQAKLVAQGKKNSEEYKKLTAAIKTNNQAITSNKAKMTELQKQIGVTGLTMSQLQSKASQLRLALRNMVPGTAEYKKLQAELQAVSARMTELRGRANATRISIGSVADGFNRYAAMGASVIAMATGVVLSFQKMIDYNGQLADAQSNVQKTTGLTREEVDELSKSFGALKTRTTRIELLQLAEEAGRLGITGVQNIQDFVDVANQMKVALGDDLSETAIREVGKMVNVYKVGEKEGKNFKDSMLALGSAINEVSASGANQAGFLVDYLKRQAGIAAQAKLSAQDNIAYAATFDEIGQSVEVSATAMNKIWMDMFQNTDVYANIAGETLKDFTQLLNTDANAAMIKFLKGLNGNNVGLEVMLQRLDGLEVGGARGVQALSALASNTQLLEQRQKTSNEAIKEATSLTNEFNLKNNNLAGSLEMVQKKLIGIFSSKSINDGLNNFVNWFGKLIGAIEDVDEAFEKEVKTTDELNRSYRRAANESEALLSEYEDLTKKGVEPTTEAKERLEEITLLLRDRLGESVVSINNETNALDLNTAAVKEQIRLKRLAADEESATLASRLKGKQESQKELERELALQEKELEVRIRNAEKSEGAFTPTENLRGRAATRRPELVSGGRVSEAVEKEYEQSLKVLEIRKQLTTNLEQQALLLESLKDNDFSQSDVDAIYKDSDKTSGPKEGDIKIEGGVSFTYKGGSWQPTITSGDYKKVKEQALTEAEQRAAELLKLQRATEDAKLALIQDSFEREKEIEEANHRRKVEDLNGGKISQKDINTAISGGKTNVANDYIAKNKELNAQIEYENEMHEVRKATIIERGIENSIKLQEDQFIRESQKRETTYLNDLTALGNNQRAKKTLTEAYKREQLEAEKEHLEEIKKVYSSQSFEGANLEILSAEQLQSIRDRLSELGLSLAEINQLLAVMRGEGGEDEAVEFIGGQTDVLGFTPEQWMITFENLDTTTAKLNSITMGINAMAEAWGMYNSFVSQSQQKELQNFEASTERKKQKHANLLSAGMISERQYNEGIAAMDKELESKKAEIAYNQAKRDKQAALMSVAVNTATAIMGIWAQVNKSDYGIAAGILTGIVGALGIAQGIAIAKQPLPAKGFEDGYYPVQRAQDGKIFNAKNGGTASTGIVDEPTYFLAGEGGKNFPEMIIDGNTMKSMNPMVKDAIYGEISRIRGFENGYYQSQTSSPKFDNNVSNSDSNGVLMATLSRTNILLDALLNDGVTAVMSTDFRNLKKLQDDLNKYNKSQSKTRI